MLKKKLITTLIALSLLGAGLLQSTRAAGLSPRLKQAMTAQNGAKRIPVIIHFDQRLDVSAIRSDVRRSLQGRDLTREAFQQMRRLETRSLMVGRLRSNNRQPLALLHKLSDRHGLGLTLKPLWSINAVATELPPRLIAEAMKLPGVESITLDMKLLMATPPGVPPTGLPLWNLQDIDAMPIWRQGILGQGVVVGVMDSGVDLGHPDLGDRWRGGDNSWFDPYGQHELPVDLEGHGTQTTGLILGGDASGYQVGVAPGAQWIAAKIFDDTNQASLSAIHQAFQWMLDPDGDPTTDDAPDIVNNSWGFASTINQCFQEFSEDIKLLKEAGIAVVFSAGNYGPQSETSISPANDPAVVSVGSVDQLQQVNVFSSRGPGACDGGIFPKLVAPGKGIFTTDRLPLEYNVVSGTSFAAPQVAGAFALLKSAFPDATVSQLESALLESATDLGPFDGDDAYGYGLLNLTGAYDWLFNASNASGAGVLLFSERLYSVDETTAKLVVTVRRIGGSRGEISVDYATSDVTASSSGQADYRAASGRLTFNDGETARTIEIAILDDTEDELNEEFEITLSNPRGGAVLGSRNSVPAVILDDDGPGSLSFSSPSYAIGEASESVDITVYRLGGSQGNVTVDYMTVDGSATSDQDYLAASGTLRFAAGETSKTLTIQLMPDQIYEGNEEFTMVLSNPTGGVDLAGGPGVAVITILDDDPRDSEILVSMKSVSYTTTEGAGAIGITVTRTGDTSESVTVEYTTSDGTAKAGSDYKPVSGRLTIPGGGHVRSLQIPVETLDDGRFEPAETFSVSLGNVSHNARLRTPSAAIVRIQDNDPRPSIAPLSSGTGLTSRSTGGSAGAGLGSASRSRRKVDEGAAKPQTSFTIYHLSLVGFGGFGARLDAPAAGAVDPGPKERVPTKAAPETTQPLVVPDCSDRDALADPAPVSSPPCGQGIAPSEPTPGADAGWSGYLDRLWSIFTGDSAPAWQGDGQGPQPDLF